VPFLVHAPVTASFLDLEGSQVSNHEERHDSEPTEKGGNDEVKRAIVHLYLGEKALSVPNLLPVLHSVKNPRMVRRR